MRIKLIFLLLMFSPVVNATDWMFVTQSDTSTYYIDNDSIKKIEYNGKDIIKIWTKEVINKEIKEKNHTLYKDDSILALEYFDCKNSLNGAKEYIGYRAGKVIKGSRASTAYPMMKEVIPDTYQYSIFKEACTNFEIRTGTRSYMKIIEE